MKNLFLSCLCLLLLLGGCQNISAQQEEKEITTFIMVRHAEKASDGSKNPPLTALGKNRAQALAKLFSSSTIDAAFSTNYTRTLETARPLAEQNKLEVQLYEAHKEATLLEELKKKYAGKTVLLVGHSNTIPAAVNLLLGEERQQQLQEEEYNKVFVVSLPVKGKAHLLRLVLDLPPATQ